jgi:hypothetical protein
MPALKRFTRDFIQAKVVTIMYYGPGQTRNAFVAPSSKPECGSWMITLEKEESARKDESWNPPKEMVRILEAANHCISIKRH